MNASHPISEGMPPAFERLLAEHQAPLLRYIRGQVRREADARDILQDTNVALFRKSMLFEPDRPFMPWACRFAHLQIRKHWEHTSRQRLVFACEHFELLAEALPHEEQTADERPRWLAVSLGRLPPRDRAIITCRYVLGQSAQEMTQRFALSRRSLFRRLEALRHQLRASVAKQITSECAT